MKKIITAIVAALLITGLLATMVIANNDKNEGIKKLKKENKSRKSKIERRINKEEDLDNDSVYDFMVVALEAVAESDAEFNELIYNLEYIKEAYKVSDKDMEYIYSLIIDGAEPNNIIEICYFWLDTNENIEIIEEVYNLKWRYDTTGWIENAFNYATENKYGVLTPEDVQVYISEVLTVQDIETANVLCRKGVLTIQEILEKRKDGTSFAEITAEITGAEISDIPTEAMTVVEEPSTEAEKTPDKDKRRKGKDRIAPENVLKAEKLSRMTGKPIGEMYNTALNDEEINTLVQNYDDEVDTKIKKKLKDKKIYKDLSREDLERYIEKRGEKND